MPGWSVDALGNCERARARAQQFLQHPNPPLTRLERGYWEMLRSPKNNFKTVHLNAKA